MLGSDPLEVAGALPGGDGALELLLLDPRELQVVLHHVVAERLVQELGALGALDRLGERARHLRHFGVAVEVALEHGGRLELALDAVEPRRDERRERGVRVRVAARYAALAAQRLALPDDAEAGGAVVERPADRGRREGAL